MGRLGIEVFELYLNVWEVVWVRMGRGGFGGRFMVLISRFTLM